MNTRPGHRFGNRLAIALLLLLVLQSTLFFLVLAQRGHALIDDAYISFRYAARWAAGSGLTWNDGESVEGFSNPLWTLLLGVGAKGGVPPHTAAPWLSWMFLLGTMGMLAAAARRRGLGGAAWGVLMAGMALDAGLILWAGSGLEGTLAAFLVAAWLWAGSRRRVGMGTGVLLGILGAALCLVRPEGALWALWGLFWLIWGAWVPRRVLLGWVLGMIPAAGYGVYRLVVFGRPVANTFFAKVEPSALGLLPALGDLGRWSLAHAPFLVLLLWLGRPSPGTASLSVPGPQRWLLLLFGWVGSEILFVLLAGGDWMGSHRYLVPLLPAFYLAVAEVVARKPAGPRFSVVLGCLVVLQAAAGWSVRDRIHDYTRQGRQLGLWLRSAAAPQDTLAVTAAGAIPYFAGIYTFDALGINDPEVAARPPRHTGPWAPGHHRYAIDRLVELRPTWIVWDYGVETNAHRLRRFSDWTESRERLDFRRALLAHPEFRNQYIVDRGAPLATQRAYTVFRRRE